MTDKPNAGPNEDAQTEDAVESVLEAANEIASANREPSEAEDDTAEGAGTVEGSLEGGSTEEEQAGEPAQRTREEELEAEIAHLKTKLGQQGSERGEFQRQIDTLNQMVEKLQGHGASDRATQDKFAANVDKLRDTFGDEIADAFVGMVTEAVGPIYARSTLSMLREELPDFREYEAQIESAIKGDPELATAVAQNPKLLKWVYKAVKSNDAETQIKTAKRRGAAEEKTKSAERAAAFVERPTGTPKEARREPTPKELNEAWKKQIAEAGQPGRHI